MKYVFNLGCGTTLDALPAYFADWQEVRVDVDEDAQPDIVADITDLSSIGDGTADAVWASHCIEHLYQHQIEIALRGIARILKADGILVMLVPDLQAIASHILGDKMHEAVYQSPAGPITAHDMVYGHGASIESGKFYMAHRSGFTPTLAATRLKTAGFEGRAIVRRPNLELVCVAKKSSWISDAEPHELIQRIGS